MEDATRIEQTQGQAPASVGAVELDTAPRPVVATIPQASRAARKSPQPLRIVATGENLLSAALPELTPQRRLERRERLRLAFRAAVECALERRAQLFVITGNLFATSMPENVDRAFVADELARLREAGVTSVAVAGPREATTGGGDDTPYRVYESGAGLRFFPQTGVLQPALTIIEGARVALMGMSAPLVRADTFPQARIEDPDDALGRADLALLIVYAPVEGLSASPESAGSVNVSSLSSLPSVVRLVIAGGAPRFGKGKIGPREVVTPGASERHSFDAPAESAGFAWIEVSPDGAVVAERVAVAEQPRADVEITTAHLYPGVMEVDESDDDGAARSGVHLLPVLTPEEMAAEADSGEVLAPYTPAPPDAERERVLARVVKALARACQPDTMARLRLTGPLTRRQFHHLPLAEALSFGRREAFAFEIDTSGLTVVNPAPGDPATRAGPPSLGAELDRLVAEYRARLGEHEREARADIDTAAGLLRARLQARTNHADREGTR
jgi:hypothetical protein